MSHAALVILFLQFSVMLAVGLCAGQVMRRLGMPAVLGELVGGIVLGPTLVGALTPTFYDWLFPTTPAIVAGRDSVIKLGMLFFLFVAGLEVDPVRVRWHGATIAWTSICGVMLPFILGFGSVLLLPGLWEPGQQSSTLLLALYIGTALSISALPVIARILIDLDLIRKEMGVVVMAAATIDDLIGWSLFAVILSQFLPDSSQRSVWVTLALVLALFLLMLTVGRWAGPHILRWSRAHLPWPSGFLALTTIGVLAASAAAEAAGIHAFLGAFLVGVALARSTEQRDEAHEVVYQFAISFFAPIYFVSVGLQANFAAHFDLVLVLFVLLVACVGKIAGAGFGAWMGRLPLRQALAVGFGMNARGAMGMVLASLALEYGIIDQRVFVALIIMAVVTSIMSGPVMLRLLARDAAHPLQSQPNMPVVEDSRS